MRSSSGRWLMRQHHQGVQTMWLKPNSTRSMPLRCAQCQGPHVIHRTAPQASGCIHTCSNFPVQVIWKTMAFDLAPMIESLHRAPCAAHMLLSMVAQSIVTVGHFFPRTARRTVPGIRSQVTVKLHGTFSRKRQNNCQRESETSAT